MTEPKSIELFIEKLVFHGFPSGDRALIAAAVKQELTRLFSEKGVPSSLKQGSYIDIIDSGHITISPGTKTKGIGMHVAQAIHRGFSK